MRKVTIIGAGNMGSAIARGLCTSELKNDYKFVASNRSEDKLKKLQKELPMLEVTTDNQEAIIDADIIILAVKPWLIESILSTLNISADVLLTSVAAGVSTQTLVDLSNDLQHVVRIMPNTAISISESMTLLSPLNTSDEEDKEMLKIFNELGSAMLIDEKLMGAATSLASCGMAFALKYIQATIQAGIEMGLTVKDAQQMSAQCVNGASKLLLDKNNHTVLEMEKVLTPGGLTIKGVNELDHNGFTSAVIKALLSSNS